MSLPAFAAMSDDLDALVRRVDEDRWLASRFAAPDARVRLISLYAANYEIARTAESVREPALGAIRLRWWSDALGALVEGRPGPPHPALTALHQSWGTQAASTASCLRNIAEARHADLEASPFQTWDDLERYVDATAGVLMRLALQACDTSAAARSEAFVVSAARAWGFIGILRAEESLGVSSRTLLPREGGNLEVLRARAADAYLSARAFADLVPPKAFPAIGYVALAPNYLRMSEQGRGRLSLLLRQAKLIGAIATGRI